jgi:ribonuclease P protein subunit POP4
MRSSAERERDVAKGELVGLQVEVAGTNHPPYLGLSGTVVDETRHTLVVEGADGETRRIPKPGQRFRFRLPDGTAVEVEGSRIDYNPEDRIKKIR